MPQELQNFWLWTLEDALRQPIWWYGWLVLIILLLVLWVFRRMKRDLVSILKDDEGEVKITPNALQELVSKSCASTNGIHSPSTSIHQHGGQIRLRVRIQVNTDCNVKEARTELKQSIENVMLENLCFSNFGGVDLVIKGFKDVK